MSTRFRYALIMAVGGAVLNLVLYFTGWQTDRLATGHHFMWLQHVIMAVVLWFGLKAVRDQSPTHAFSYGRGVATGVVISLYAGLMSGVYNAIHFNYINRHFADYQLACLRPQWTASGMNAADMAQAEKFLRLAMTPLAQFVLTPIVWVGFGLFFSLIMAAVLKRPAGPMTSPPFRRT